MAAMGVDDTDQQQPPGDPYIWDDNNQPGADIRTLWSEVAQGIDRSQTVVWRNAVESLDAANRYLASTQDARVFVEKYMKQIIGILVEQQPSKIGQHERSCVEESLELSVMIVAKDLNIQENRNGLSVLIEVLALIFNKKKSYYKGSKGWNVNHLSGLPEVRLRMIDSFRQEGGFQNLAKYLIARIQTPIFPSLELLHQILNAIADGVPSRGGNTVSSGNREMDDDAIAVAQAAMRYIASFNDESMRRLHTEMLNIVRCDLQRIFDRLVSVRREKTYQFYDFWRELVLKLITSESLPLRLFGWEQLKELIDASQEHRPPAKSFFIDRAGCSFVNGLYSFAGLTTDDGYAQRGVEISYDRRIPKSEPDVGGKKLTLFRCTMRSQQKWWFLSIADEEQPGTDRDIDYYQHKSKEHEETEPPMSGWVTCRNAGIEPPPRLQGRGLMVPEGEDYNTLEHQLAKCAIENKIVELVLGASLHREVVHRSIPFIEFLALMCNRDVPVESGEATQPGPNAYCLQKSHLLLAWKTCTSKADVAVSDEIYHLLVSILPSLPDSLAIPLLQVVQESLEDTKQDLVFEVAEFCAALASHTPSELKDPNLSLLSEEVRAVVLNLLWGVLTHPEASSLKPYEILKRYVANELGIEPFGRRHREKFLKACTQTLSSNARQQQNVGADEILALRMVKLTQFVLNACPREQAEEIITADKGSLASLIFNELTAYLSRRKDDITMSPSQRKTSNLSSSESLLLNDMSPLPERLGILRYVYGISEGIRLSTNQLQHLWALCSIPSDREELMVFVASASTGASGARGALSDQQDSMQVEGPQNSNDGLTAAFSNDVRSSAFVDLMCSEKVDWGVLGERAYRSFQSMFKRLGQTQGVPTKAALNALWRICLTAGNEIVASQSMKDLLSVYSAMANTSRNQNSAWSAGPPNPSTDRMLTDEEDNDFGKRVFDCLVQVKKGLDAGDVSSERSAERCLRILNAAVGQDGSTGRSVTTSAIASLNKLVPQPTLANVVGLLPHGMRGQAGYRRIGIMVKRTSQNISQNQDQSTNHRQGSTKRFFIDVHPLETLASVKTKVSQECQCRVGSVKPISVSGRLTGSSRGASGDSTQMSLNIQPDDSTVDQLGIVHGCEMVFLIQDRQAQTSATAQPKPHIQKTSVLDLNKMFSDNRAGFANKMFETLLSVLEALPWRVEGSRVVNGSKTHKLVWDLLLAMPTNKEVVEKVHVAAGLEFDGSNKDKTIEDVVMGDSSVDQWSSLLDKQNYQRSVYVLQTIDACLQPAPELLSSLHKQTRSELEEVMSTDALAFRKGFIGSGGFDAVVSFFSTFGNEQKQRRRRMGDAAALRILKCCLFGNSRFVSTPENSESGTLDVMGSRLLESLSSVEGLLRSLTAMVVGDEGISTSTISDVLKFLRLLFFSPKTTETFVSLPDRMAEQFLITLLLWEGDPEVTRSATIASAKIRESMHDLILQIALLARHALPWLIGALGIIDVNSDATADYFDVLKRLVTVDEESSRSTRISMKASEKELQALGTAVCQKLASCPRPTSGSSVIDATTGVLCGCLKLLRALIENGGGDALAMGCEILLDCLDVSRWSELATKTNTRMFSSPFKTSLRKSDKVLIDLMGVVFDGFLSPGGSSSVVSICCDKESRQLGFDAVAASARSCSGSEGYLALVKRINGIVSQAAPYLRHRWGQVGGVEDGHLRSSSRNPSKYSGLRNQGCTCYMNSFLQQLFMMNDLRKEMCAAPLPEILRSSGGSSAKGIDLVGKKFSFQWDNGQSYDAMIEAYEESTGMHTIQYCALQVPVSGGNQLVTPDSVARLPAELPDEFILSEGRPGKETGVFELVTSKPGGENTGESMQSRSTVSDQIKESEDQSSARHLFEEVQRTFIHLDEGSRGRCFDPRAFVEACACLKLEFDVWQQNDASEFAMKLLDRMEIALKRWAPHHFRYLEHTFGLKQTKQKICKECGLKTNREENLMSIDCQIRGKTDIHEALETMCEVEYMEGNNKVFCDRCKKNTDTVLRTAISALPDMLILSLKRFDLDYNTFETVKLNSRCAFGQTLNMKKYTLEGIEATEKGSFSDDGNDPAPMDTSDDGDRQQMIDPLSFLPDDDYEYKLAGVLVHAGVAQGGHYYSFIKDRSSKGDNKWYKFDDEDVSPFDPSCIENECFGGKLKKEQKWPNGQVHTVESEQFANALMLFYEKVKPTDLPKEEKKEEKDEEVVRQKLADRKVPKTSGFDAFEPDVQRSNATHKWQTFLFDSEFQTFLKGLLGLCRLSRKEDTGQTSNSSDGFVSWQTKIVDMLLSFFFDIRLYAADKSLLNDWVSMLSEILSSDQESAKNLVQKLAQRTQSVSANWLRTYVAECPEKESRIAAVRIFAAAIRSCVEIEDEKLALIRWTSAWRDQLSSLKGKRFGKIPLPISLEGTFKSHEDVNNLNTSRSSCIGVIMSYINVLFEVAPRTWRFNSELCMLIRDIATSSKENDVLRSALNEIQVSAKLICLVIREKAGIVLKNSFPGASMSFDLADSQARLETNPSSHLLPINSSQMMNSDMNQRGPSAGLPAATDFLTLFEALGVISGMRALVLAPIVIETAEQSRGRSVVTSLSKDVSKALTTIYHESCSSGSDGMSQQDIEAYLSLCRLDSSSVPTQKILDILTKYPSVKGNGSRNGGFFLGLEGFLAYYRDTAQTNEALVRVDLHTFGYRPDLSRRPKETRINLDGSSLHKLAVESVVADVSKLRQNENEPECLSELTILGLDSFDLHTYAYSASEVLAEYLLASTSMGRDTSLLITNTQKAIFRAPTAWAGNEMWEGATMIFRVLVCIQDSYQQERIARIMQNSRNDMNNQNQGIGLLQAAKSLSSPRSNQNYSSDMQYAYEKYFDLVKELMKLKPVTTWMSDHRSLWSWMERDLIAGEEGHSQRRSDYSGRREGIVGDNPRSDSDMQGVHDSEEEEEEDDSRMYDDVHRYDKIYVERAGLKVINGIFERRGTFEGAGKYIKKGAWNGNEETFSMFRCNVSNNTKHWYISIVPAGVQPGTNADIDFYSAPVSREYPELPPASGWTKSNEGLQPVPIIHLKDDEENEEIQRGRVMIKNSQRDNGR